MNKVKILFSYLVIAIFFFSPVKVKAQTEPEYPYYVIQGGDTLNVVAQRFGVSVDEIINLNEIADPNAIAIGDALKIPGFEGVQGELVLHTIQLGESYQSLTEQYQFPTNLLARLNRLLSQDEIFVGSRLIVPIAEDRQPMQIFAIQTDDQTRMELGAGKLINPWSIVLDNQDVLSSRNLPGDLLYTTSSAEEQTELVSIPGIQSLSITPLPFVQGKTIEIRVKTLVPMDLSGSIDGKSIPFFPIADNEYASLHGISAQADTGVISIQLEGISEGEKLFALDQRILVESGYYGEDPAINVDPVTIDPAVTEPEQELVEGITSVINPERYWDGMFQYPVDEPCLSGGYGGSRVYNGTFHYYHTGIDFAVCTAANANIYAAAPGRVVFAGPLTVRGNAVIIDHGWGVFTGYWHQSSLSVKEGDMVDTGQILGIIGTTGRSTGYHLHFEVWVNGTQVDPSEWLEVEFP